MGRPAKLTDRLGARLSFILLAVELDQVEGAKDRGRARLVSADEIEHRKSVLVGDDCIASMRHERAGSAATAAAAIGSARRNRAHCE